MVDDESDFFGTIKDTELPEGEGISIYQEQAPGGVGKTVQTHFARNQVDQRRFLVEARERFKKQRRLAHASVDVAGIDHAQLLFRRVARRQAGDEGAVKAVRHHARLA